MKKVVVYTTVIAFPAVIMILFAFILSGTKQLCTANFIMYPLYIVNAVLGLLSALYIMLTVKGLEHYRCKSTIIGAVVGIALAVAVVFVAIWLPVASFLYEELNMLLLFGAMCIAGNLFFSTRKQ